MDNRKPRNRPQPSKLTEAEKTHYKAVRKHDEHADRMRLKRDVAEIWE